MCDSDLVGKKFEEGKKQLDVRENFYGGDELDEERVRQMISFERSNDSTFNIVGEEAVRLAIQMELISEGNVGKVDGVPFALLLL